MGQTKTAAATATAAGLLDAILGLAGDLDIHSLLERFVTTSVSLTGARYGAINIVDELGTSTTFVQVGVDEATAAGLGHPPHAHGVLGEIPDSGVLRLEDLSMHPAFRGLPRGHPPMGSFLGAAVRIRGERYGTLYLSEKDGGFNDADEQVVIALAAGAAVAIQNAQLYAIERRRERWLTAAQAITTMLLEGSDQEEVLEQIATTARLIDDADTAALVLPGPDGRLITEIVSGPGRPALLGVDLSDSPRVRAAFDEGTGKVEPSLARAPGVHRALVGYGPALFTPMRTSGRGVGVLLLLRRAGAPPFTASDLSLSQTFASQAALAFVLAEARRAQGRAALHDERGRIARDLHDLAIQQLFAAGMALESAEGDPDAALSPRASELVEAAHHHVEAGIRQIRVVVRALDDPGATIPLAHRVRAEVDLARTSLGFRPGLVVALDGEPVDLETDPTKPGALDDVVSPGRANNVVAVVREGLSNAARHAHPRTVAVRVAVTGPPDGSLTVEVEDDGVGVPASPTRASGTKNLAVRAEQSGGSFALVRPPSGRGALLRWTATLD